MGGLSQKYTLEFKGGGLCLAAVCLWLMPWRGVLAATDEAAGLPQLDVSTWPMQVFWLVVSFAIAYGLMRRFVVPTIGAVLEERHSRIQDDLQQARLAADEAASVRQAVEKQLAEVRREASNHTRQATEAIHKEMEGRIQVASGELNKQIDAAEASILAAKNEGLAKTAAMAAAAAAIATEKLTALKTSEKEAVACIAALAKPRGG